MSVLEEGALRILLIEDEEEHTELICRGEFDDERGSVDIVVARSVREAKRHLAEFQPDLLIADLWLGDGRGTDLLGSTLTRLPAVLMTSHGEEFTAVEAAEFGAIDFVVKSPGVFADMPRIAKRAIRRWSDASRRRWPHAHYRRLVEHEKDIIYTLDPDGHISFANPAVKPMLGYQPEELLGKHFATIIPEHARARTNADFQRLLKTGEIAAETVLLDKQGNPRFVEYSSTVIQQDGKVIGTRGIIRDITARKRAEEELARYQNHLEELVTARTTELARTNEQLKLEIEERKRAEKALRYRGEFENLVAALSTHFINLPLDAVDNGIDHALQAIGSFVSADRSYVVQLGDNGTTFDTTHEWCAEGVAPQSHNYQRVPVDQCPWWMERLGTLELVHIPSVANLPPGAIAEKTVLRPGDVQSTVGVPIHVGGGLIGFTGFDSVRAEKAWSTDSMVLLKIVGELFGGVLARSRSEQAVQREQRLLRQLVDLQEQERKLVAYEIHDGLAQQVAGALFQLQAWDQLEDPADEQARRSFEAGLRLLSESVQEARRLISGLRPPILDESGVVAAVEYLICECEQGGGPLIEFEHDVAPDRLAPPIETAVFRIVQEALSNACRHSQSEKVCVTILARNAHVSVAVEDWGIGFDPDQVTSGRFGLQGIRERARLLGGKAVIHSTRGKGTRVSVTLPLVQRATASASEQGPAGATGG